MRNYLQSPAESLFPNFREAPPAQTVFTRNASESDIDEDRFLYESKYPSSGRNEGGFDMGVSTVVGRMDHSEEAPEVNTLVMRMSALSQYKVMIRRTLDRYGDDEGYKGTISASQMVSDIKEICELALDLNAAVATMSEELEQLMAVKQDLEEVQADDQARIKALEERGEEAVVHWKRKYERAMEELENAEKLIYDQRSNARGQASLNYDDERHASLERKFRQSQAEVDRLELEKQTIQQKLAEVTLELRERHSGEVAQLEAMYAELQQDRDAISRRLGEALRDRSALELDRRSLEQSHEAMRLELDRMTRRQNDLIKKLVALSEENKTMQSNPLRSETKLTLEEAVEMFIERSKTNATRSSQIATEIIRPERLRTRCSAQTVEIEGTPQEIVEIIREVPVEVIKEVPVEVVREVEKIREVPAEVIKEVIKEVPVEVVKEVPVEVKVVKEVPVEVIKEIEVIKEVPVEIIREVEVLKEVPVEVIREIEVIKEVPVEKIVEMPVEVIKEVPVEVMKEVEVIKEVPIERTIEIPIVREVEKIVEVPIIKEIKSDDIVKIGDREVHIHLHTHQHDHAHSHAHQHSHYHQYGVTTPSKHTAASMPTTPATRTPMSPFTVDEASPAQAAKDGSMIFSSTRQVKAKRVST